MDRGHATRMPGPHRRLPAPILFALLALAPIDARADADVRAPEEVHASIAASDEIVVDLGARSPLALALLTVGRGPSTTSPERLAQLVREVFEPRTDLAVDVLSPAALAPCKGRLACIVRVVRPDVVDEISAAARATRFMLVLSVIPAEKVDYVSVAFVDTDLAVRALAETVARTGTLDLDAAERRIADVALLGPEEQMEIADPAELARILERLLVERWRRPLESSGHFAPYGALVLEGGAPGATIKVDGRVVGEGRTSRARIHVYGLTPGPHDVTLEVAGDPPSTRTVAIEHGRTSTLVLATRSPTRFVAARQTLRFASAGVGAAGVVLAGIALALPSPGATCWSGAPCGDPFKRFGASSDVGPLGAPEGSGPPVAPIALGLVALGATTLVTNELLGEDDELPWLPVALGVAAGALAFGASLAFDPSLR